MDWYQLLINESSGEFKDWLINQSKEDIFMLIRDEFKRCTVVNTIKREPRSFLSDIPPFNMTLYETGKLGENAVMEILKPYVVENTALKPHAGDISIVYKGKPILVEVKNYSNTVPTKECNKFLRDVETNYCVGGMFISLNTKIAKKETLALEYNNKPCLFVSIPPSKEYINCCLEIIYKVSSSCDGDIDRHLNKMQDIVYNIGLTRDKLTTVQCTISEVIIELWKQQESMLRSLDTFSYNVAHEINREDIEFYNNPKHVQDIVNSIITDKVTKNGNKYTCKDITIEILKTKVYIYTKEELIPKKDYIYKNGVWKIPVSKENYNIITKLLS